VNQPFTQYELHMRDSARDLAQVSEFTNNLTAWAIAVLGLCILASWASAIAIILGRF
jgi:hypothetical protein